MSKGSVFSAVYGVGSVISGKYFVTLPIPKSNTDLPNQTMIVTGANAGLGFQSSLHLSRIGLGKLIMAVRTPSKGEDAKKRILEATRRAESSIEVWTLDMEDHESIRRFAEQVTQLPRIDGVLANAGMMTSQFMLSEQREKTLNINVVNTFYLYLLLLPKMRESGTLTGQPCHYAIPNSALHYSAPLAELDPDQKSVMDRLNDPKRADMAGRYPLSKLLVLYAVRELAAMSEASGKGTCILNTPNPSYCKSDLMIEYHDSRAYRAFEKALARSTEEGSRVLVHGLMAGPGSNGQYMSNCQNEIPACHVTGQWGQKVQKKFTTELLETLDKIQPGISSSI